ncbi:MAG: hypothetical protein ACP5O2_05445 [Bacteroidales bacterium]
MRSEFFNEIAESRKKFLLEVARELGMLPQIPEQEVEEKNLPSNISPSEKTEPSNASEPARVKRPAEQLGKKKKIKINPFLNFLSF